MCVKRNRQRLNSTTLWQGWKAKVVHHINQKLVMKNSGSNWLAMLALPSLSSIRIANEKYGGGECSHAASNEINLGSAFNSFVFRMNAVLVHLGKAPFCLACKFAASPCSYFSE